MHYNHVRGIKHIIKAFGFSMAGFHSAWRYEAAFRIEVFLFVVMVPIAIWLGETSLEKAILLACLFVVLLTELLNSAVEAVVDRVGEEHHSLSGRAKDFGSAAVFVSLINTIAVWCLILIPKFL